MIGYRSGCFFCLVVKNDRLVYKFDRIVIDLACFILSLSKKYCGFIRDCLLLQRGRF